MMAGNVQLMEQIKAINTPFDALLASDYVHLPELIGLNPSLFIGKTAIAYFHENQLTYPVQTPSDRDYAFGLANWMTMLTADKIVWNSTFHLNDFLQALPALLRHYPEPAPQLHDAAIREKSCVIPVGLDFSAMDAARRQRPDRRGQPIRLLWPHRWEHDKNPTTFFDILIGLHQEGLPFELIVLGKSYADIPPVFDRARVELQEHVVHWGFVDRSIYPATLASCDVVISTALHENQGLAVIEAIRAGCDPLLPDRLAYPELLPSDLHDHLYTSDGEFRRRLRWIMKHPDIVRRRSHAAAMNRFAVQSTSNQLDALFDT